MYPVTNVDLPAFAKSLWKDSGGFGLYCGKDECKVKRSI